MKKFCISVSGIERKEYYEACRESGRRIYMILGVSMIIICGAIMLAAGSVSLRSILWPLGIYVVLVVGYDTLTRLNYKDQLKTLDPPVEYEFQSDRWRMHLGEETADIEWKATPRLRRTKRCLFLYNDDATSSLVPLRLLTAEQTAAIENWFQKSRPQAKVFLKEAEKASRQKFRDDHPGLRLGRTGPAWGPWKRR